MDSKFEKQLGETACKVVSKVADGQTLCDSDILVLKLYYSTYNKHNRKSSFEKLLYSVKQILNTLTLKEGVEDE